jgi:LPXTG-motif cell wall-anchored protein
VQYVAKAQPLATPTEIVLPQAGVTSTTWSAIAGGGFLVILGIIFFAL